MSRIQLAQQQVGRYVEESGRAVFRQEELYKLLDENRIQWNLPLTTSASRMVQKFIEAGFLRMEKLHLTNGVDDVLYLHGSPSIYEIAFALRAKSYISHYPAVYLHELTTQVPKTIYTTREQSLKPHRNTTLNQTAIDRAFGLPQRRSQLATTFEDYTIVLLNGMHTGRTGVLLNTRYKNAFSYTSLERTLIDITVRPNYAGGAFAVLDAFRRAAVGDRISTNKFQSVYSSIPFVYPYHQALGFYLERAGYRGKLMDSLRSRPRLYTFYLDYAMEEKQLNKDWNIWHPTGM